MKTTTVNRLYATAFFIFILISMFHAYIQKIHFLEPNSVLVVSNHYGRGLPGFVVSASVTMFILFLFWSIALEVNTATAARWMMRLVPNFGILIVFGLSRLIGFEWTPVLAVTNTIVCSIFVYWAHKRRDKMEFD